MGRGEQRIAQIYCSDQHINLANVTHELGLRWKKYFDQQGGEAHTKIQLKGTLKMGNTIQKRRKRDGERGDGLGIL